MRRLTSWPEPRSVTIALGTSLPPAGRGLEAVVGPEADVAVAVVVGAAGRVVAEVAVRAGKDAADRVGAGVRGAGAAGRAAVVVDAFSVVEVDGLVGAGAAVDDVVESVRTMAVGSSRPPPPLQAEPAKTRRAPRAARREGKGRQLEVELSSLHAANEGVPLLGVEGQLAPVAVLGVADADQPVAYADLDAGDEIGRERRLPERDITELAFGHNELPLASQPHEDKRTLLFGAWTAQP